MANRKVDRFAPLPQDGGDISDINRYLSLPQQNRDAVFTPTQYERPKPTVERAKFNDFSGGKIFGMSPDKFQQWSGTLAAAIDPRSVGGRVGAVFAKRATDKLDRKQALLDLDERRAFEESKLLEQREFDAPVRDLTLKTRQAQLDKTTEKPSFTLSPGGKRFDASGKEIASVERAPVKDTSLVSNYKAAKKAGFKGTLTDWKRVGKIGSKADPTIGLTKKEIQTRRAETKTHMTEWKAESDEVTPEQVRAEEARFKTEYNAELQGWPVKRDPRTGKKVYLRGTGNIVDVVDEFGRVIQKIDRRLEGVPSTSVRSHK